MTELVHTKRAGGTVSIVLNAPEKRNALSYDLLHQLSEAIVEVQDTTMGLVITGAGHTFSAGADFNDLNGKSRDREFDDLLESIVDKIVTYPVPIVAAVEGPCIGAGAHLALACDARYAGESSYFQIPAVRLGLLYNPRAIASLSTMYPRDTLRRLLVLGERFAATSGLESGLTSHVVADGEALAYAMNVLGKVPREYREAMVATRQLLNALESNQYDETSWQRRRQELLESPARAEAVKQARSRHS